MIGAHSWAEWAEHACELQVEASSEAGHLSPVASPPESPRASAVAAARRPQDGPPINSSAPAGSLAAPRSPLPAGQASLAREGKAHLWHLFVCLQDAAQIALHCSTIMPSLATCPVSFTLSITQLGPCMKLSCTSRTGAEQWHCCKASRGYLL